MIGSFIDSILGATLQQTYYDNETKLVYHSTNTTTAGRGKRPNKSTSLVLISGYNVLNNEQVNFVSLIITTIFAGWIVGPIIFS